MYFLCQRLLWSEYPPFRGSPHAVMVEDGFCVPKAAAETEAGNLVLPPGPRPATSHLGSEVVDTSLTPTTWTRP